MGIPIIAHHWSRLSSRSFGTNGTNNTLKGCGRKGVQQITIPFCKLTLMQDGQSKQTKGLTNRQIETCRLQIDRPTDWLKSDGETEGWTEFVRQAEPDLQMDTQTNVTKWYRSSLTSFPGGPVRPASPRSPFGPCGPVGPYKNSGGVIPHDMALWLLYV